MDSISIAQSLASQGFHVFPIIPNGKTPAIAGFDHKASDLPDRVDAMWRRYAADGEVAILSDYNVGVYAGRFAGEHLLILDVDTKKGKKGLESLEQLEMVNDTLPDTFTVRTPTGGLHYYFTTAVAVRSSADKLGDGLDVRGDGGYVVAPGSEIDGKAYEVINDRELAEAPKWLVELAGKPRKKEAGTAVAELDTGVAMDRATKYLIDAAPEAIEGSGGDETTYKVACAVADFGVSAESCLALMIDVWNPAKARPMWEEDQLEKKVENAYRYRENKVGSSDAKAAFKDVPLPSAGDAPKPQSEPTYQPFVPTTFDGMKEMELEPRRWVLGHHLLEGKVTVFIAPPGVGKSTLTMQWGIALATGREEICGSKPHQTGPVLFINNEDETDELKRRFAAIRRYFAVTQGLDSVHFYSGVERPFIIGGKTGHNEALRRGKDMQTMIDFIKARKIKAVFVDPFVETHQADENDNREISQIARWYRQVAFECGCSVVLVHHTRKPGNSDNTGHVGNMDSGRGASSLIGVARVALTLHEMSTKDADAYSISANDRGRYVRLDDAKANLSLKKPAAAWFRKEGVKLSNGDEVGVLKPIELKAVEEAVIDELFDALLNWPEFEGMRLAGATSLSEATRILTDGRMYCGAKGRTPDAVPSDRTVQRRLVEIIGEERFEHMGGTAWLDTEERDGREIRLLCFEAPQE